MIRPARLIFWFCAALVLNLTGFMTLAAVLPQLITNWSLTGTEAGWLGGIYFAGYVCAVPVLTTLTDRIDARRICLASALCAGAASIAFALLADGFWSALALRFLAGAGLGGTYMPGLKALTDRLPKSVEGRAVTYYSAVFALGTALSFLSGGEIAAAFGWRWAFAAAGVGCVIGFGIIVCVSGAVPIAVSAARAGLIGAFTIVFRNRQAMGYIMAFFGYAWEVFAFRVWVVAFVFYCVGKSYRRGIRAYPYHAGDPVRAGRCRRQYGVWRTGAGAGQAEGTDGRGLSVHRRRLRSRASERHRLWTADRNLLRLCHADIGAQCANDCGQRRRCKGRTARRDHGGACHHWLCRGDHRPTGRRCRA
jgi:MFS family permease